ncbi:F420-dependent methylenetetrahydromethanopterin dehydrogenase [Dysgonomonas sp. PH5-45]|uniref:hypothetical protein n=1 Tax=unclassified Dysgonomonas TaxID=2630389 RepID=UPI002475C02B|nr:MULTISPECIES: hypothetical protein [unclassified Dysgonomonas]MDH6354311.1 F420-dependent methylenetetrahydromethanopterin dehydrogenase [Dysgonomonas sp. PH5-45]MDH6387211.1 F420-dependent methylenetetrahydromethanopterin dehydrogenase [Dysgonomonas sp. PH5-37]
MSEINNDVLAAIAMAIYELQDEVHDVESNVLTIKRQPQEYLPWAAKELLFRQQPNKM